MADSRIVVFIGPYVLQAWKIPEELNRPRLPDEALNLVVPVTLPDIICFELPLRNRQSLYVSGWYSGKGLFYDYLATKNDVRRTAFPMHSEIASTFFSRRTTDDTRLVVGLGSKRSSDRNAEQWGRLPTADEVPRGAIGTPAQPTEEAYCKVLTRFDNLLVCPHQKY